MGIQYTTSGVALTDASGGTVVDSIGVVSSTQFAFDSWYGLDEISTASGSYGTCSNSHSVVLTRAARVLVLYSCYLAQLSASEQRIDVALSLNGTVQTPVAIKRDAASASSTRAATTMWHQVVNMPSGTNTIQMNWKTSGATGYMGERNFTYLVLGK